jgi:uncharacterized protein (TIGR04255 family)
MGLQPGVFERSGSESENRRLWLENPAGSRVVQIQHDRLAVHWTKGEPDEGYPRFTSLRESLVDAWNRLDSAFDQQLMPDICQVLYVNHIGAESGWKGVGDTQEILASWRGDVSDDFLPKPVIAATYLHFHMPDPGEWLDIETGPIRIGDESVLAVYVGARGRAGSDCLEGVLQFMDLAHEWIVRGFTSLTTSRAHNVWGRMR